jgi:hypothetical protein
MFLFPSHVLNFFELTNKIYRSCKGPLVVIITSYKGLVMVGGYVV